MSHAPIEAKTPTSEKRAAARLKIWATAERRGYLALSALGCLDVFCAAAWAWGLAVLLDGVWRGRGWMSGLLALAVALFARAAFSYANQKLAARLARRVIHDLRLDLLGRTLRGRGGEGAQTHRLGVLFETTEALEGYYARFVPARVAAGLSPLAAIALVAFASPLCALILLLTLLPFVALMALSGMATAAESQRQMDALTRLAGLFSSRIRVLPLILAFAAGTAQTEAVGRAAQAVGERTLRVLRLAFSGSAVLEFFSALSVALVAVYCGFALLRLLPFPVAGWLGFQGSSPFAAAFFALALSPEVYAPLRQLSAAYHEKQAAEAAAVHLMAIEDALDPPQATPLALAAAPAVVFDAVTVTFPDDPEAVIGPLSLSAAPGRIVAIAGDSGAGKSTMLRLLLGGRAYGGHISVDGRSLDARVDLGPSVGWMSQHTPVLGGTLRDNLTLARPGADDAALMAAAARAGLGAVLAERGLDGDLDERGSGLSGGERRRIGLARVWLKDAPLLVLDEPTADLDADAEAAMVAAISAAARGRTVILATHNAALLAIADTVVRL
jgi:ATP-binding cassette subfamily C protein CydD